MLGSERFSSLGQFSLFVWCKLGFHILLVVYIFTCICNKVHILMYLIATFLKINRYEYYNVVELQYHVKVKTTTC